MKRFIIFLLIFSMLQAAILSFAAEAIIVGTENYQTDISVIENGIEEIKSLMQQCSEKGIICQYEQMRLNILERFFGYLKDELSNGVEYRTEENGYTVDNLTEIFNYNIKCMKDIYAECKSNLESYLKGDKSPMSVPEIVTSDTVIDGKTVKVNTAFDGEELESQNSFLLGYLGQNAKDEIGEMQNFGANLVQIGIGISTFCQKSSGVEGWIRSYNSLIKNRVVTHNVTSEQYRSSNNSLKITNSTEFTGTSSNTYSALTQPVIVEPNSKYTLSFWYKGTDISSFKCKIYTSQGGTTVIGADALTTAPDWVKFEKTFTTSDETEARIYLSTSGYTKELYIDDVSFVKSGDDKNLIVNGDFETPYPSDRYVDADMGLLREALKPLKEAEENNVKVSLLFNLDYFVNGLYDDYSDLKYADGESTGIGYIVSHPVAKSVTEYFINTLVPEAIKYKSLNDICMVNEPWITTRNSFYDDMWAEFLEKEYGTIENLNKYWSSSYDGFDKVPRSQLSANQLTVSSYDYKNFNESVMTEWISRLSSLVKKHTTKIPVHAKVMQYLQWADNEGRWLIGAGLNPEKVAQYFDLNGNDASLCYDADSQMTKSEFMSKKAMHKNMWYDFLQSIKEAPVFNSEDHVIANGDKTFDATHKKSVSTDQWMSAVHGRSMASVWLWDRGSEDYRRESILFRPDVADAVGTVQMDLNRLAEDVYSIINTDAKIGIFYSDTSKSYQLEHVNAVYETYKACMFNGLKAGFVVESQLDKLNDYEVIIIPDANFVPQAVVEAFSNYEGELAVLGKDSLKYTERKEAHSDSLVSAIHEKATVAAISVNSDEKYLIDLPDSETLFELVSGISERMNLNNITIIDADTKEKVQNVEYLSSEINGEKVINICNYDWDNNKNIQIYVDGVLQENFTELRSGEDLNGTITINSFEPIMLKTYSLAADAEGIKILGTKNETEINGKIVFDDAYKMQSGAKLIFAVYNNNRNELIGVQLIDVTDATEYSFDITYTAEKTGENTITAKVIQVLDMENIVPVCSALEIVF